MSRWAIRWTKRLLTPPLFLVAALFFLVEGLLWRMAALYAALGRLPVFRSLERWIASLPPYGALLLFAVPSVCLAPVKFLALYWIAGGHPALGASTILGAKIGGTALVARLYQLTRPSLVRLQWFAWAEERVLALRAAAFEWWRSTAVGRWISLRWKATRQAMAAWRERWRVRGRSWLAVRWAAIRSRFPRPAASDK